MFRLGGIKLGKFLGIPVYIHPTWFIIFFLFSYSYAGFLAESGISSPVLAFIAGALTAVIVFTTLLAHEFGHAIMARYFGIPTDRITLFILGGVAQIRSEPRKPHEELLVALAGPAVSAVCMLIFGALALGFSYLEAPAWLHQATLVIAVINFIFVAFNMLPGFPMDGGRVLRSVTWMITGDHLKATRVAYWGGKTISFMLMGLGVLSIFMGTASGLIYILMGWFLGKLAGMAYKDAQLKTAFNRVHVRDLMRPVQVVVPAHLTLRDVVRDYVNRIHADRFPVVKEDELLGYISADDIAAIERGQWDYITADRLARPYGRAEILTPELDAFQAYQRMTQAGRPQMPVFRGRELVGYFFVQDVVNYMRKFRLV